MDSFRRTNFLIPEQLRLRRVSKDEASWFEPAQVRLLTIYEGLG
jgi:hypothetical protein